jgi:NAD dependent epimerase/dehydratase family enzyme
VRPAGSTHEDRRHRRIRAHRHSPRPLAARARARRRALRPGTPGAADERGWDPSGHRLDPADLADLDAVVHLAGAGVADKRWSEARKAVVLGSRVDGTTTLARAMAQAAATGQGPKVLLSSSAIGWYGDTGDRVTDETGPTGEGFLAEVCRQWEASTAAAGRPGSGSLTCAPGSC